MLAVLQRVSEARVIVDGETIGEIGPGLLALVCAERGDTPAEADKLLARILKLRIFADEAGKMNRAVSDIGGAILLVPNFTLAGDARKGRRPSFDAAMSPDRAAPMFDRLCAAIAGAGVRIERGVFRAHMRVSIVNDGPVTILLDSKDARGS